jgi:hypothetical protein
MNGAPFCTPLSGKALGLKFTKLKSLFGSKCTLVRKLDQAKEDLGKKQTITILSETSVTNKSVIALKHLIALARSVFLDVSLSTLFKFSKLQVFV